MQARMQKMDRMMEQARKVDDRGMNMDESGAISDAWPKGSL